MKKIIFIFIFFTLVSSCKQIRECINGEPLLSISFYDRMTGSSLDSITMAKIFIKGVGAGTTINNQNKFNQKPPFHSNEILLPLNIEFDSSMFIITNNTYQDTMVFYYKREYEFIKQNCNRKKGEYVVKIKDLKVSYTSLDSLTFSTYYENSLSVYY